MREVSPRPARPARRWAASLRRLVLLLLSEQTARRRAWIILATVLVCSYSLAVLVYVRATPEIGLRCAFTPVVNHFYPEFLYPPKQKELHAGDRVLQVGDQPVEPGRNCSERSSFCASANRRSSRT
jgi:hypothetical protein